MNTTNLNKLTTTLIALCIGVTSYAQTQGNAIKSKGLASKAGSHFQEITFTRHAVGDNDIKIEILYAGICHSDLSIIEHYQGESPLVPGHEIVGRVVSTGKKVTKFKVGDYAGVGCMVNSCGECDNCKAGMEQYCENQKTVFTYGFPDSFHHNEITMGGYSNNIVVSDRFALVIPKGADIKRVAPLLCAGVTTWSPIKFSKVKKDDVVGVAGFGGLGHMAVQYLVDLGAKVTVFDITEDKRGDAQRLGATKYVNVNNKEDLKGLNNSYDFILSTIPENYDPMIYVNILKINHGELAIVGLPYGSKIDISPFVLQSAHRRVYGSLIGGVKETQEMLDYSVKHNIYPEIEMIKAESAEIDKAYQNVHEGKVKFRYVIDMKTLK